MSETTAESVYFIQVDEYEHGGTFWILESKSPRHAETMMSKGFAPVSKQEAWNLARAQYLPVRISPRVGHIKDLGVVNR